MTTADFYTQLYQVQSMDLELDRLKHSETHIPPLLAETRSQFETLNDQISETLEEMDKVRRDSEKNERELEDYQAKLGRARAEQNKNAFESKVQTQYENLIQQLQDRVSEIEETLEPLYAHREVLTLRKKTLTQEHKAMRPRLEELETLEEQRIAVLRSAFGKQKETRDTLFSTLSSLDRRVMTDYALVRKSKSEAMVAILHGRCSGCNMQLPTLILQKVAAGKPPVPKCPSCGRLLMRS
jgi:uncharacterized protein